MYSEVLNLIFLIAGSIILLTLFLLSVFRKPVYKEEEKLPVVNIHKRKEYPYNFDEFIGQDKVIENLKISSYVAKKESRPLPHTLFYGMPGLGKTTLSEIIAQELETNFISLEGVSIDSKETILKIIDQIDYRSIVFIDEIHQMNNRMSEIWYKIMENFTIDIVDESIHTYDIPEFTTIGATTDFGKLLKPFRDRFVHKYELLPYNEKELSSIVKKMITLPDEVADLVASISQRTPRLAKSYIKSMVEYTKYKGREFITKEEFTLLLDLKDIHAKGLTNAQLRVLASLRNGEKMGKLSLAMSTGLSVVDLEEVVEPYLVVEGYVTRTPRGRSITDKGIDILKEIEDA